MSKIEKLIERLKSNPKDFTWYELKRVLAYYGYFEMDMKGKTGGSRRKFRNNKNEIINLHEPHPSKIIKTYVIKRIVNHLQL
jgi:predicted RNA binding protein YcfA (HicA-like mRNA interferase family)